MKWFTPTWRKRLRRIGVFLGAGLLLLVVAGWGYHVWLRHRVESYRAELKQAGVLVDLSAALPPPVPEEQNSAGQFLAVDEMISQDKTSKFRTNLFNYPIPMAMVGPGRATITSQQAVLVENKVTNRWEQLAADLQEGQPILAALQAFPVDARMDFKIRYEDRFNSSNFVKQLHLAILKKSAIDLQYAGLKALHDGDPAEAVQDARIMLMLGRAAGDQRYLISHLVHIAMDNYAQHLTWELVQSPGVTEAQLAALQADWERTDALSEFVAAMPLEILGDTAYIKDWRASSAKVMDYLALVRRARLVLTEDDEAPVNWTQYIRDRVDIFCWQNWWSYRDEYRDLCGDVLISREARAAVQNRDCLNRLSRLQADLNSLGFTGAEEGLFNAISAYSAYKLSGLTLRGVFSSAVPTIVNAFRKSAKAECARQTVITAIALKRYQLKHGNWPAHLETLVPEFVTKVPVDPMIGQPLHYRLQPEGSWLLYSVGTNGVDDGGNPALNPGASSAFLSWQDDAALDWVWPQPVK